METEPDDARAVATAAGEATIMFADAMRALAVARESY